MNTTIQIFENSEFGAIRTMSDQQGEPLFCAKDVAVALGYGNSREALRKHVDREDVTKRDTPTAGGEQLMTFINESGLYALIMGSKLESARRFKRWVTAEAFCSGACPLSRHITCLFHCFVVSLHRICARMRVGYLCP